MLKFAGVAVMLAIAPYLRCIAVDDGQPCTMVYVYGVNAEVTNAETNAPISGATLTLRDGTYIEVMQSVAAGEYFGAGERKGTYTLTVAAAGFQTVTVEDIVVRADPCHVIPVTVKVPLTSQPSE